MGEEYAKKLFDDYVREERLTPEQLAKPQSQKAALQMFFGAVHAIQELRDEIAAIRDRGVKYVGTYQRSGDYEPGMLATHKGSMWHCVHATRDEPGVSGAWQLAVKAGRDAR